MSRRRTIRMLVLLFASFLLGGLLAPTSASAATFVVNKTADVADGTCNNHCTLRDAILAANATPGADTIRLPKGKFRLTIGGTGEDAAAIGDLDITDAVTIVGKGPKKTKVIGQQGDRIFDMLAPGFNVTLQGLRITGGLAPNGESGSAIRTTGPNANLTILNSTITGNHVAGTGGGGVYMDQGNFVLTNSSISNNTSTGCCAGFSGSTLTGAWVTDSHLDKNVDETCCSGFVASVDDLTITNSTFNSNVSHQNCCAGFVATVVDTTNISHTQMNGNRSEGSCCAGLTATFEGPSSIRDSDFSGNLATSDCCAGFLAANAHTDPASMWNVSAVRNEADAECCAGFILNGGDWNVRNVTSSNNVADQEAGGMYTDGAVRLNNVTIANNRSDADATGDGGGGGIYQDSGTITMSNSILFGNTDGTGVGPDCMATITSTGYNFLGNTSGCTMAPTTGDQIGVDPQLRPLANNGGPGETHAIKKNSPARDGGNPAPPGSGGTACEATDERGVPRNCDAGAYEYVECGGVVVNRTGTSGKDTLRGTKKADGMLGFAGKDTLSGKKGDDALCGGPGRDLLKGAAGNDSLDGGPGRDTCDGGPGDNAFKGCERED
jgi:CSLREA domain-containing protein